MLGVLLNILWKLAYRGHRLRLRVHRVIKEREAAVSRYIVYEDVAQQRFIQKMSFSCQATSHDSEIADLSDALNALEALKDVHFFMDANKWRELGGNSIDEALQKARTPLQRSSPSSREIASQVHVRDEAVVKKHRAYAKVKEVCSGDSSARAVVRRLSRALWRKARTRNVSWALESASNGTTYQLLVIAGRRLHQIP